MHKVYENKDEKNMQYQKIKLKGGAEVTVDFDGRTTKCKGCGKPIRFGITRNGMKMPISEMAPKEWVSHFSDCKKADMFRGGLQDRVEEADRNQEYINNL
ncbi:MAG: hypothetical protein UR99_C0017G0040 [Candidatus Moranbacteria bacterium GW2011_GWD2_36_12]|nr:MAG: hypothetical protein UR99_C0017G0040 [Candidatus Moranbacteria bacterium GW2011_GWD2_36_12]